MVEHKILNLVTNEYNQWIRITDSVEEMLQNSSVKNGVIYVITKHTTTGITVNEALECLESDLQDLLNRLAPENHPYAHARMLRSYGSTAGNPSGHLKSHLTGNHCCFPVIEGRIIRGEAQEIYFCEFDGPAVRQVSITLMGE